MAAQSEGKRDRYLLGDSAPELAHLVAQAEVYAEEARQLLDLIGIASGAEAVDVGCGVLGILHLLCERVGPDGRVVGVDREPRMIEAARRVTAERGLVIELVEEDATGLSLPSGSFDLVHERTVLLNVAEPGKVVAEMVRVARRGGVVALQEPDSASWLCNPPHPTFGTLHQELLAAYRAAGKDFDQGRTIARRLRDAGLTEVQVRATARVTRPGEYYHTFLLALTGLVRDQIIAAGRLSACRGVRPALGRPARAPSATRHPHKPAQHLANMGCKGVNASPALLQWPLPVRSPRRPGWRASSQSRRLRLCAGVTMTSLRPTTPSGHAAGTGLFVPN